MPRVFTNNIEMPVELSKRTFIRITFISPISKNTCDVRKTLPGDTPI